MVNYFLFWTLRISQLFNEFYWTYQDYYIATWAFNQTYVSVFIRCFGVLLITFQRYISLCKNGSHIEQIINVSHRWSVVIVQWSVPMIYSIPLLLFSHATFFSLTNLEVITPKESITLATSMAVLFVTFTFILCSLFYVAILRFLIYETERSLHIQMLGLLTGFALFLVYNIVQFTFSLRSNVSSLKILRIHVLLDLRQKSNNA
ncbi:hypothetical protein COOONC_13666 [Cooperia oncophora]